MVLHAEVFSQLTFKNGKREKSTKTILYSSSNVRDRTEKYCFCTFFSLPPFLIVNCEKTIARRNTVA